MTLPQPIDSYVSSGHYLMRSAVSPCARICTFLSQRDEDGLNTGDSTDYSRCNTLHHRALSCVLAFRRPGQTGRIRWYTKLRSRTKCTLEPGGMVFSSIPVLVTTCVHPCQFRVPGVCLFRSQYVINLLVNSLDPRLRQSINDGLPNSEVVRTTAKS